MPCRCHILRITIAQEGPRLRGVSSLNRPFARALLASAAIAAAIALAGCDAENIVPTGRAQAPISDKTLAEITAKNMDKEFPDPRPHLQGRSGAGDLEENRDGEYALLKTFPICRWSGDLGPKKKKAIARRLKASTRSLPGR